MSIIDIDPLLVLLSDMTNNGRPRNNLHEQLARGPLARGASSTGLFAAAGGSSATVKTASRQAGLTRELSGGNVVSDLITFTEVSPLDCHPLDENILIHDRVDQHSASRVVEQQLSRQFLKTSTAITTEPMAPIEVLLSVADL